MRRLLFFAVGSVITATGVSVLSAAIAAHKESDAYRLYVDMANLVLDMQTKAPAEEWLSMLPVFTAVDKKMKDDTHRPIAEISAIAVLALALEEENARLY